MKINSFSGKVLIKKSLPFLIGGHGPEKGDVVDIKLYHMQEPKDDLSQVVSIDIIHGNYKICMHVPYKIIEQSIEFLDSPAAKILFK